MAETNLIWSWLFVVAICFLYIAMFSQTTISSLPKYLSLQSLLRSHEKTSNLLSYYRDRYKGSGKIALQSKKRGGRLSGYMSTNNPSCRLDLNNLDKLLADCANWEFFQGLLLDSDSHEPMESRDGYHYDRFADEPDGSEVHQEVIKNLDKITGLTNEQGYKDNVLNAMDWLLRDYAIKEDELRRQINAIPLNNFDIPMWDKVVSPLPAFRFGGLIFVVMAFSLLVSWENRTKLLNELLGPQERSLSWKKAVTLYKVKLPWILIEESEDQTQKIIWLVAKLPLLLVPAAFACTVVFCVMYPVGGSGWLKLSLTVWNVLLGICAIRILYDIKRQLPGGAGSNSLTILDLGCDAIEHPENGPRSTDE
jgi:hypothetical protein